MDAQSLRQIRRRSLHVNFTPTYPKLPPKSLSLQSYPGRRKLWLLIFLHPKNRNKGTFAKTAFYKSALCFLPRRSDTTLHTPCFQKNPRVRKIRVRNSGAGNGCANFLDAWNFCVLSAGKSMSIKFCVLGFFFWGGGGECRFYFYGLRGYFWLFFTHAKISQRPPSNFAAKQCFVFDKALVMRDPAAKSTYMACTRRSRCLSKRHSLAHGKEQHPHVVKFAHPSFKPACVQQEMLLSRLNRDVF